MEDSEKYTVRNLAKEWFMFAAGFFVGGIVCLYLLCWMLYGYTSSRHVCNYVAYVAIVAIPIALVIKLGNLVRKGQRTWSLFFVVGLFLGPVSMVFLNQLLMQLTAVTGFYLPFQGWG